MSGPELPEGWVEATVGDVADQVRSSVNPKAHPKATFNYVSLEWVGSGTGEEPDEHPTLGRDIGSAKLPFEPGDVLYGKLRPYLRKTFVATRPGVAVTDLVPLRAKDGIEAAYLKHFLLSPLHSDYIAPLMKGIGMPRLGVNDLQGMPLPLPPSNEQKRIVARLDALQARSRAAREALAEVPALLDLFRQSVLAAAFRGDLTAEWRAKNPDVEPASKLLERIRAERRRRWEEANPRKKYVEPEAVDPEAERMPDLPEGWCWARFDEIGELLLGRRRAPEYRDLAVEKPYLRVANVKFDRLELDDVLAMQWDAADVDKYALQSGDILLSEGQSYELVGQSAMIDDRAAGMLFQSTLHRLRTDPTTVHPRFAQLVSMAWMMQGIFTRYATITTNIAHLPAKNLKRIPFPLCPTSEQRELVRRVDTLMASFTGQEQSVLAALRELDALDQSILARAFRGDLVDQDPGDEPADVLLARVKAQAATQPARKTRGRKPKKGAAK